MIILTDNKTAGRVGSIDKMSALFNSKVIALDVLLSPRKLLSALKLLCAALTTAAKHKSIILAIGQPEVNLIVGFLLKLAGKRLALYMPELYDDRPISRFLLMYSKALYETVILPSHEREMIFCAKYFVPKKTVIILNDSYQQPTDLMGSNNNSERAGFVYTGIIYPSRPLDNAIISAKIKFPNEDIYLYGKGDEDYIKYLCSNFDCKYMGEFEMQDEVTILANYQYGLLTYPMTSLNNAFCAPNKIFSYQAAGCSIFCDSPNNLRLQIMNQRVP